jgi:hypothetical protein
LNALVPQGSGQIALSRELLPLTQNETFELAFQMLKRFVEREGTAAVAPDQVIDGFPLGTWVANTKFLGRAALTEQQVRALESLPGWIWT